MDTGFKILCTGTKEKFRPFVDALPENWFIPHFTGYTTYILLIAIYLETFCPYNVPTIYDRCKTIGKTGAELSSGTHISCPAFWGCLGEKLFTCLPINLKELYPPLLQSPENGHIPHFTGYTPCTGPIVHHYTPSMLTITLIF